MHQQSTLAVEAAGVAGQRAVATDDAVTRHHDRDWVAAIGGTDRAHRTRCFWLPYAVYGVVLVAYLSARVAVIGAGLPASAIAIPWLNRILLAAEWSREGLWAMAWPPQASGHIPLDLPTTSDGLAWLSGGSDAAYSTLSGAAAAGSGMDSRA